MKKHSVPQKMNPKYTNEEIEEYKQVFAMFDTDGSGAIGNDELGDAMRQMGMNPSPNQLQLFIQEVDADGNGEIDFEEFCDCMKRMTVQKKTDDEIIRECFNVFDSDKNGMISESEFKHVLREVGGFTDNFAEELFREVDVAGNGHLEIDEFANMVRNYLIEPQAAEDAKEDNLDDSLVHKSKDETHDSPGLRWPRHPSAH